MENDINGFRVTLLNSIGIATPKKYYVYVDLKRYKVVADLERHIRNIFQIAEQIYLSIGSNILPTNESIMVIQPHDDLRLHLEYGTIHANVCTSNFTNGPMVESTDSNVAEPPLPPVKKRWKEKVQRETANGISECLKLLKKQHDDLESQKEEVLEASPVKLNESVTSNVNEKIVSTEAEYESAIERTENLKLKRKRKRKQKSKIVTLEVLENGEMNDPQYGPKREENTSFKPNSHIIFAGSDEENFGTSQATAGHCTKSDMSQKPGKVENKSVTEENEIWKMNLLALANEPLERKVFHRISPESQNNSVEKDSINSINEGVEISQDIAICKNYNPLQFPLVTKFHENDILLFKMLKIGPDYSPTVSSDIIGKVISVNEDNKLVSITVLKGNEELELPGGKLFIKTADAPKSTILDLKHCDLIEPRLMLQ